MSLIEALETKDSVTYNGAITNSTSSNANLDLFFLAGACRRESIENINTAILKSYEFDRIKTIKIIFWAGDIRQGAGERRFFKIALNWLYDNHKDELIKYLNKVPEFSRWDVLFDLNDKDILQFIADRFVKGDALLCKWLPRKIKTVDTYLRKLSEVKIAKVVPTKDELLNLSDIKKYHVVEVTEENSKYVWDGNNWLKLFVKDNEFYWNKTKKRDVRDKYAIRLRRFLNWSPKHYRKHVVTRSNVVETKMCAKKWNEIDYSKVPSVAMNKYNKAWYRNDEERFEAYLKEVESGKQKINASVIFPHDIIGPNMQVDFYDVKFTPLNQGQITQWNNLPNYLPEGSHILPVVDTSGSMADVAKGLPMKIAVSLGLYLSERNVGPFKDAFITFSDNPKLQHLKGNINQRINQLVSADWNQSTDITKVFALILSKAKQFALHPSDMPQTVLIISDMEFNECGEMTNFEYIKQQYLQSNYTIPNIVFWNVNGRVGNVPIKYNENGVALVSGASPSIIKAVLGNDINPIKIMDKVIESERYKFVH